MCTGDHACLLYASESAKRAALVPFIHAGLRDGAKVVVLAEKCNRDALTDFLADSIAAEGLSVDDAEGTYLDSGHFDADRMLDHLRQEISTARTAGYSGLRIAGDMGWALASKVDLSSVMDYEDQVDALLGETGTAGLCMYDRRRFDLATSREAERIHHLVLAERDVDGGAPCELLVERGPDGETVLRGEAGGPSAASLARSLAAAVARTDDLRLDLSDLSFVGAAGLRAIRDAARTIEARGGKLTLVSPRPVVRQVVGLMGLPGSAAPTDGP